MSIIRRFRRLKWVVFGTAIEGLWLYCLYGPLGIAPSQFNKRRSNICKTNNTKKQEQWRESHSGCRSGLGANILYLEADARLWHSGHAPCMRDSNVCGLT